VDGEPELVFRDILPMALAVAPEAPFRMQDLAVGALQIFTHPPGDLHV
jgi:hypothetical protein